MSSRFTRFGIVAIASFLLLMAAELPLGPMAAKSTVVVLGVEVAGSQVAVTLGNPGSSPQKGTVELLVELSSDSVERVVVAYALRARSSDTYVTSFSTDVSGATECGISEGTDPM